MGAEECLSRAFPNFYAANNARYTMASSLKRILTRFFDSQPGLNHQAVVLKRNFDEVNRTLQSIGKTSKKHKRAH